MPYNILYLIRTRYRRVLGPFPPDGARTRALDLCLGPDRYTTVTLVAPGATDATVAIAAVAVVCSPSAAVIVVVAVAAVAAVDVVRRIAAVVGVRVRSDARRRRRERWPSSWYERWAPVDGGAAVVLSFAAPEPPAAADINERPRRRRHRRETTIDIKRARQITYAARTHARRPLIYRGIIGVRAAV